jgi:hypothetical protein
VEFKITHHTGFSAPADALDILWQHLESRHDGVSFAKGSKQIYATWRADAPVSMTRDERDEAGRDAVLAVVRGVCERAPELKLDWFAVSPHR